MTLPALLDVRAVMGRYGFRDERTARRLMNEAGAFKAGGRLLIREDALGVHERRLMAPPAPPPSGAARRPKRSAAGHHASPTDGPDWWRGRSA